MICKTDVRPIAAATTVVLSSTTLPPRWAGEGEPGAPVKPDERPTLPPPRENPHYPTHTPPKPGTTPSQPCPGTDDPDEEFPACHG